METICCRAFKIKKMTKYLNVELQISDLIWIVSDGGADDGFGYHGWVIANDSRILCEGSGLTPGNSDQMNSLRSESGGMLHALTAMATLIEATKFHGHITIASDNLELIKRNKIIGEYSNRLPGKYTAPKWIYNVP